MARKVKAGPYFAVSTKFPQHKKVLSIPPAKRVEALGVWLVCGCWSADNLEDGFVPKAVIASLGGTADHIKTLVGVGLWEREKGGIRFVNYSEFNFTREEVDTSRKQEAERKRRMREAKAAKHAGNDAAVPDLSHGTSASVPPTSHGSPVFTHTHTHTQPHPLISNSPLGGNLPKQGEGFAPQICGREHSPADACGACGAERKRLADLEAQAARDKSARDRASQQQERARRKAEDEQVTPATPEQVAAALALAKQALNGPGERE